MAGCIGWIASIVQTPVLKLPRNGVLDHSQTFCLLVDLLETTAAHEVNVAS